MPYRSTKTYGPDLGLSACFRQHRATHSHCSKLHGYALGFKFVFEGRELDDCNWVQDFGGLKSLKQSLQSTFDHKLVVAQDDPELKHLQALDTVYNVADVLVLPAVGCEAFAKLAYDIAEQLLRVDENNMFAPVSKAVDAQWKQRVRVVSVECFEHGANSAIYIGEE